MNAVPGTSLLLLAQAPGAQSTVCGDGPNWACDRVYEWAGSSLWAQTADWVVAKPLTILAIVLVALLVNRLGRFVVKRVVLRTTDRERGERYQKIRARAPEALLRTGQTNLRLEARAQTLVAVGRSLVTLVVTVSAFIVVLDVLEINLAPFIAGAGIIGIALGFGAQTIVRDFLNGFFLVVEDQYGVGDWVDLGADAQGVVEKITLRATRLRAVDGTVWHVPNGEIRRAGNQSQDFANAVLDVQVGLDVDIDRVLGLMVAVTEALRSEVGWNTEIIGLPEPLGVNALTPQGVTVRLVVRTRAGSQWRVQRELRRRLKIEFDRLGLTSALTGVPTPLSFGAGPGLVGGGPDPSDDEDRSTDDRP